MTTRRFPGTRWTLGIPTPNLRHCNWTGESRRGDEVFAQVQAIREKLVRDQPDDWQYQADLASLCTAISPLNGRVGNPRESLALKIKTRVLLDKLTRDHPSFPALWNQLGAIEMSIGITQIETGDRPGSIESFRRG